MQKIEMCNLDCKRLDMGSGSASMKEIPGSRQLLMVMSQVLRTTYSVLDNVGSILVDRRLSWWPENPGTLVQTKRSATYICRAANDRVLGVRESQQLMRKSSDLNSRYIPAGREKVLKEVSLDEIPCAAPDKKDVPTEWEKALRMRMYRPSSH